jgi:hypothetical protein
MVVACVVYAIPQLQCSLLLQCHAAREKSAGLAAQHAFDPRAGF